MNSNILKILSVTVFFVSAYSCGSSADGSEGLGNGGNGGSSSQLGGKYTVISMVSDSSVDLNNDGIASTDLLTEIDPAVFNSTLPELEIKPVVINNQLQELMSFNLPHSNLTDSTPGSPSGVKFTTTGIGYTYEFNDDTQVISIHDNAPSSGNNQQAIAGHMESIQVIGDNKLKAIFTKYYYDFSVTKWKMLTITCIYTKM